ncbi:hypothetical protein BFV94_4464 [Alteromonas macleodii]|uniref:Uncharacterized protein n=1 Tax=Alteromonas macleodii TaxID=28108 RepID=A0AB36FMG5_ALTMA|nr:hypothetical protein BFV95_4807 [Alteromonas macleodii]OES25330.1 hypothetical protein BFV94_4464 [Alteromonas macleodii]OES25428.1 hypothetical protein BFV93_4434 [Alteromonas macleodii]OES38822.1 hypothetical protein BFV96_4602 [Alteromonas macleodii]
MRLRANACVDTLSISTLMCLQQRKINSEKIVLLVPTNPDYR